MPQQKSITRIKFTECIEGSLVEKNDVQILGTFEGSLLSEGDLFVEESGSFSGEAHTANAYIRGSFRGNLNVQQNVFLFDGSSFNGILDCSRANITLGAICCGEVRILSKED